MKKKRTFATKEIRKRIMKKSFLLLSTALLLAGMTSCEKEQFDKERYNEYVDYEFMIDYMDRSHDWNLVKNDTVTITTDNTIKTVQILTANNYTSADAEIAAQGAIYDNEATLAYTVPLSLNQVYVAALDMNDNYLGYLPMSYGTKNIELRTADLQGSGSAKTAQPQTFTYLYNAAFPEPGDFDYNDIVMRISKSYGPARYVVMLKVTLEAVGTMKQIAGAIHLGGVKYDDIYKVELERGNKMDKDYPLPRTYINSNENLVKGRNGEAIINLFEDAHWCMLKEKNTDGSLTRMKLNTSHSETDNQTAKVDPVTVTYRISFYDAEKARDLTFDRIDPFILEEYNGGLWEVHTYKYKFNDVLKNIYRGNEDAYDNHVSWCVVVPQKDFRYPIEGMPLGTYNSQSGEVFGPYTDFAYWMQSHTRYTTWYMTANRPQLLY